MYTDATYEWQWQRFASIGELCWVTLHAAAGRFPLERFKGVVAGLGCAGAAQAFDVPDEILPEIFGSSQAVARRPAGSPAAASGSRGVAPDWDVVSEPTALRVACRASLP